MRMRVEQLRGLLVAIVIAAAWLAFTQSARANLVRVDDVPLGDFAYDIGAADFDHNGTQDLALTTHHSVAILKGHDDGTFTQTGTFSVGAEPGRLVLADLNHDGNKDIATANYGSDNVSVLIGRGDATFKRKVNYRAADGPIAIAVGKLNHDRRRDIAIANLDDADVSVLLGKGHGEFRRSHNYRVGGTPRSVAIADLNGDQRGDLAVTKFARIAILTGRRDETLRRRRDAIMHLGLWDVIAADFDRDGAADLLVNNVGYTAYQGVHLLLGHGNATFTDSHTYTFDSSVTKIGVTQVTGDRRKDLVVTTEGYPGGFGPQIGKLTVMRGQSDGTFSDYFSGYLDGQGGGFAVADFDDNRKRDVAVVTYTASPEIEIFLND